VAVIVIGSLMAVAYIWRVVETAWFRQPPADAASMGEAPLPMLLVTWSAAVANLWFGLVPALPLQLSTSAAEALLKHLP